MALYLLTALAILGHLALVRASVNRCYELPVPHRVWQIVFALHGVVAVAVPVFMVRAVREDEVHPAWLAYFGVCGAGLVVGCFVLWWRWRHETPAAQVGGNSTVLDGVAALGRVPAGRGALAVMARCPGNEIYTVEFVERQVRLPRLPAALDGLSILHLTDLHLNGTPDRSFFEWACERCVEQRADLVVMTGDVMDHLGVVDWLPTTLGRLTGAAPLGCCFVLGNHDVHVAEQAMRDAMTAIGWESLAGRAVTKAWRGETILLAGSERPWAGVDPPLDGEAGEGAALRILLSHAPHLVRRARRQRVDLVLAGHLHGGQIRWPLLGPLAGGRFHGGLFDLPPTILHVSRGLGQMSPYRWRCRPEVTKLVLRAG